MNHIKGLDEVLTNLNKEIEAMKGRSMKGLIESVIIIRRSMDEKPPLIPVDTTNLRASWFTDPHYVENQPAVRLGFTASYAWWVHENVGANFKRPGAGAKFLEAALKNNANEILETIRKNAEVK